MVCHQYSRAPLQLSAPLYLSAETPTLYLRNPNGGLLGGDRHQLQVRLEAGASLELRSQGATRIHPGLSEQHQHFSLAAGSCLIYRPHPLIPGRSADYRQETRVDLATDARLLYAEVWAGGRVAMGECWQFQRLESRLRICRDGQPVLWENQRLGPDLSSLSSLPLLGGAKAWGTFYCFGPWPQAAQPLPDLPGGQIWALDNPTGDQLVRCTGPSAQQIWELFQAISGGFREFSRALER